MDNHDLRQQDSEGYPAPDENPDAKPNRYTEVAPDGIEEPENPLAKLSLEELGPDLRRAAERAGWAQLMPVQALALPYLLEGRDILVQSRTGSGKTGAFLLPALERLEAGRRECQALILVPTRELALQVEHEATMLFGDSGLEAAALYGGVGYGKQREALSRGVQVVVGTPGRVLDHLQGRNFNLDSLRMLVLDEADRMLSIGFYPDMKDVQRYLPKRNIPTHFFSATFPPQVRRVALEFMPKPNMLSLSHNEVHISGMDHLFYAVKPMEKDRVLARILELESPSAAIIFCNTRANVHYVSAVLKGFGYNADELSSDLSQVQRERVLTSLRRGELRFLVATDVAARGIDIPELSHVIMYEPPEDHESYIHRAGRTGRAGAGGTVISLVDVMQKLELARIARHFNIELRERAIPDEETLATVVGERLTSLLEGRLRKLTGLQRERLRRFMPLAASLAQEEDPRALLAMLLDEQYHASLHAKIPGLEGDESGRRAEAARAGGGPGAENAPEKSERSGKRGRRSGDRGGREVTGEREGRKGARPNRMDSGPENGPQAGPEDGQAGGRVGPAADSPASAPSEAPAGRRRRSRGRRGGAQGSAEGGANHKTLSGGLKDPEGRE